ncbi:MAG TPA: cache domain-containing protein, partial [Devosia sp.]
MRAPRLTLSQRLFLLTAAALLPGLAILGFNEVTLRQSRAADLHVYSARVSELAHLEMERVVTGAAALMVAVATSPSVQERDLDACDAYLTKLQATLPQVNVITITDAAGRSVCSSDQEAGQDLTTKTAELLQALETKFFAVGSYVMTAKGPGLTLGTKAPGVDGQDAGYVLASIGLDYLGELLRDRSSTPGSALSVADRNGIILAREPLPEQFVGTKIPDAYLPLVTGQQSGTIDLISQDGTHRIMGYQPATSGLGLYVSAGVSLEQSFAPIN